MPFAKYGFNKSHAAAYSLVSYITAWLKFHYPAEYISAAMNTQGEKQFSLLKTVKPEISRFTDLILTSQERDLFRLMTAF